MFRYSALALESDWDEFGYTDASDIEIESDILELGDEYEPEEPRIAPQARKDSVAVAVSASPVMRPTSSDAVMSPAPATSMATVLDSRDQEIPRRTPTPTAGNSASEAVKADATRKKDKVASTRAKATAVSSASKSPKSQVEPAKARSAVTDAPPPRKSPGNEHTLPKNSVKREGKSVAKAASTKSTVSNGPSRAVAKPPVKPAVRKSADTKSASRAQASKATRSQDGRARSANSAGNAKPAPAATKSASKEASKRPASRAEGTPKRSVASKAAPPKRASAKLPKTPARSSKATPPVRKAVAKAVPSKQAASAKPAAKKAAPAKRKR